MKFDLAKFSRAVGFTGAVLFLGCNVGGAVGCGGPVEQDVAGDEEPYADDTSAVEEDSYVPGAALEEISALSCGAEDDVDVGVEKAKVAAETRNGCWIGNDQRDNKVIAGDLNRKTLIAFGNASQDNSIKLVGRSFMINGATSEDCSCYDCTQFIARGATFADTIDLRGADTSAGIIRVARGGAGGSTETLWGSVGDDYLFGGEGDDTINGLAGNDWIEGRDGEDSIDAGEGNDVVFGGVSNHSHKNFDESTLRSGKLPADWAPCAKKRACDEPIDDKGDDIHGRAGNDLVFGCAMPDTIEGEDGDDKLFGGTENDTLIGGNGTDKVVGNSGDRDTCSADSETKRSCEQ